MLKIKPSFDVFFISVLTLTSNKRQLSKKFKQEARFSEPSHKLSFKLAGIFRTLALDWLEVSCSELEDLFLNLRTLFIARHSLLTLDWYSPSFKLSPFWFLVLLWYSLPCPVRSEGQPFPGYPLGGNLFLSNISSAFLPFPWQHRQPQLYPTAIYHARLFKCVLNLRNSSRV